RQPRRQRQRLPVPVIAPLQMRLRAELVAEQANAGGAVCLRALRGADGRAGVDVVGESASDVGGGVRAVGPHDYAQRVGGVAVGAPINLPLLITDPEAE